MKKVLITGAGGLLGNELIKQLLSNTLYRVFVLTSNKQGIIDKFPNQCLEIFSIEEWKAGKLPLNQIDTVIHCAFARDDNFVNLKESLEYSKAVFSNNKHDIINISSRSVYGQNPKIPWNEDSNVEPNNLYAFAKYASEMMIELSFGKNNSANFTNIRLAGLIGKEFDDRLINKFIDFAITNNKINIKGGNQQFAYLDIRDAAKGIISLLNVNSIKWKPLYNLGHTQSFNIVEIANTVKKVAKEFIEKQIVVDITRTDENLYAELDSSAFYQDTGWRPKYSLEDTVKSIFEYKLS